MQKMSKNCAKNRGFFGEEVGEESTGKLQEGGKKLTPA